MDAMNEQAALLQQQWQTSPRWAGIRRDYSAQDVIRLRGAVTGEHPLARQRAARLWEQLQSGTSTVTAERWPGLLVTDAGAAADGGPDAFELMTSVIEAGGAGVRFEDQLAARVLIPTGQHIAALTAARLAADVLDVPALVIARTHARAAALLTSDVDERDHEFLTGERTADGFHRVEPGLYACVTRGLAFAPYADLLWLESSTPDLAEARAFADIIRSQYPDQLLAYTCSPPISGPAHLDDPSVTRFRQELAAIGYRYQCITPAASPTQNEPTLDLDRYAQPPAGRRPVAAARVSA